MSSRWRKSSPRRSPCRSTSSAPATWKPCSKRFARNGGGSTSSCTRSPSRRRPICTAASPTARARASPARWTSRATRSSVARFAETLMHDAARLLTMASRRREVVPQYGVMGRSGRARGPRALSRDELGPRASAVKAGGRGRSDKRGSGIPGFDDLWQTPAAASRCRATGDRRRRLALRLLWRCGASVTVASIHRGAPHLVALQKDVHDRHLSARPSFIRNARREISGGDQASISARCRGDTVFAALSATTTSSTSIRISARPPPGCVAHACGRRDHLGLLAKV